jgi:tetratricopeptide (TPR) repeat protein
MGRHFAGRLVLVIAVACSVAACGWVEELKARKAFKEANALYQRQEYKAAAARYEEAIAADPNLTVAYFYLGNSYDQMYKPARAG